MKPRQAGFTLLEMLVALIVFGLLMAGLSQTMHYGLAAWTAETHGAVNAQDMAAVQGTIRRLIEQAAPDDFAGRPDGLAFTTSLPDGAGLVDRLADVDLSVAADGYLVLSWTAHPAGVRLGPVPVPHQEPLLDDVLAIRVSYLVPQPAGPPAWVSRSTGARIPLLVRIGFRFSDATSWPDLVVAPTVGGL